MLRLTESDHADDLRASEPPLEPESDRPSGGRMGRYRLAHELASGGMATLYLAIAEGSGGFGKVLALKRMHPHLAKDADFRRMFLDEARTAALLHHPNVCGVLDYGEEDGLPFLTMEYLLGESVSLVQRALARAELSLDDRREAALLAARVIADAAHGLHAAHELRDPNGEPVELIHRDVSPQNLFITYDGVTRVVDFGIARSNLQEHRTTTGTVKGKFAYMAPEQALGAKLDRRADIWSLGVVLWETLAGQRLFRRKSEMETLYAVAQAPVPNVREVAPHVDAALAEIVARAISRQPETRFATAEEMARALERYLVRGDQLFATREVAEWMARLFPKGLERKRALLADALAHREAEPIPPSESGLSKSLPSLHPVEHATRTVRRVRAIRRRRRGLVVAGILALCAAAGIATLAGVFDGDGEPVGALHAHPPSAAAARPDDGAMHDAVEPIETPAVTAADERDAPGRSDEAGRPAATSAPVDAHDAPEDGTLATANENARAATQSSPSEGRRGRPATRRTRDRAARTAQDAARSPAHRPASGDGASRDRPFLLESLDL